MEQEFECTLCEDCTCSLKISDKKGEYTQPKNCPIEIDGGASFQPISPIADEVFKVCGF